MTYPIAMTIAGSDPSGGAGIQADLKTFSALGVYGAAVLTALTAQNTRRVTRVESVSQAMVEAQVEAVLDDLSVGAVKTGILPTSDVLIYLSERLGTIPWVADPVMVATSGDALASSAMAAAYRASLPAFSLITPNTTEAEAITGVSVSKESDMSMAAEAFFDLGARAVLLKGGHLEGAESMDMLYIRGNRPLRFATARVRTENLHGTGCTLSAAIAANVALGLDLPRAVTAAKAYVQSAIVAGAAVRIGGGHGPVNHFYDPKPLTIWKLR